MYGVYHVANLKETANPHYILREFLVHSVEEVCVGEWGGRKGGNKKGHACFLHCRRKRAGTSSSSTSRRGLIMVCLMNLEPC